MANHPGRSGGPYTATVSDSGGDWAESKEFPTMRQCRAWAEEFGQRTDRCVIRDAKGRTVGLHVRRTCSNEWYAATPALNDA
jgi:hypothetical protein